MATVKSGTTLATIDAQYISDRQGKPFVSYVGLLDAAHRGGLTGITTELLQAPADTNGQTTICLARAQFEDGRIFTGIGDANPANVSRAIAVHAIRMAETRAKARALRDALNIAGASLEELGGEEAEETRPAQRPATPARGPMLAAPGPDVQYEQWPPAKPEPMADESAYEALRSNVAQLKTLADPEWLAQTDLLRVPDGMTRKVAVDLFRKQNDAIKRFEDQKLPQGVV